MAAITWSQVVLIAPELETLPSGAQDLILDYVNQALPVGPWGGEDGPKIKLGRVYLAAHLGTLSASGTGGLGQILEVSEGDVITRFAEASKAGSSLEQTGYGQEFKRLSRKTTARFCGVP